MTPAISDITTRANESRAPLTHDERADTLRPYLTDVRAHEPFTPQEELERAREVEDTELACWRALLTHPSTVDYVLARIAERAGDEMPDPARLRSAARGVRRDRTRTARQALERQADRLASRLRNLSEHWNVLEAVIAHMRALPADPGAAAAQGARFRADSKRYAAWLERVAAARRAATEARGRFVNANLRLVFYVARRYDGRGIPLADLVQEGNLGLIRAVDRFDHRRGFRFSTYATWWIRHMIGRAVANRSRAVRVPVYLLELCGRIEQTAAELERELRRSPTDAEIASVVGVPEHKVRDARVHCQGHEVSLDDTVGREGERGSARHDIFSAPSAESDTPFEPLAAASDRSTVAALLSSLSGRERDVIEKRFGLDASGREWTLREIGEHYDLSRERIRQIQDRAMKAMREALTGRENAA